MTYAIHGSFCVSPRNIPEVGDDSTEMGQASQRPCTREPCRDMSEPRKVFEQAPAELEEIQATHRLLRQSDILVVRQTVCGRSDGPPDSAAQPGERERRSREAIANVLANVMG